MIESVIREAVRITDILGDRIAALVYGAPLSFYLFSSLDCGIFELKE